MLCFGFSQRVDLVLRKVWVLSHFNWVESFYKELPLYFWKLFVQLGLSLVLSASRRYYFSFDLNQFSLVCL